MKKLFNSQETMVDDMIDGFVAAYPQVARGKKDKRVVVRRKPKDKDGKVTLKVPVATKSRSAKDVFAFEFEFRLRGAPSAGWKTTTE